MKIIRFLLLFLFIPSLALAEAPYGYSIAGAALNYTVTVNTTASKVTPPGSAPDGSIYSWTIHPEDGNIRCLWGPRQADLQILNLQHLLESNFYLLVIMVHGQIPIQL